MVTIITGSFKKEKIVSIMLKKYSSKICMAMESSLAKASLTETKLTGQQHSLGVMIAYRFRRYIWCGNVNNKRSEGYGQEKS